MASFILSRAPIARPTLLTAQLCSTTSSARSQASLTSILSGPIRTFITSPATKRQSPFVALRRAPVLLAKATSSRTYASASSTQPIQTSPSTAPSTAPSATPSEQLNWDQFLGTRRGRRFLNTGSSVVFAIAAVVFGSPLIGALDLDTQIAQAAGVDALVVIAAGSVAIAVGGWFIGRAFGGMLFSLWARNKGWTRLFVEKEKSFFDRIKRYRADPTSSSPQNPIPDYYGEKIGSVKDYRRWLKDQRAYTKKMYRGVR